MDIATAQNCLAAVVRELATEHRDQLEELKENHADIERPDFLWHYLLQSFATMGRSSGWEGLIGEKANYDRVTYPALMDLPASERLTVASEVCRVAKVRMPDRKGTFIIGCFERIHGLGGPEAAKSVLLAQRGREEKIRWLKAMPGIGDKYARNIMMDVYHEDFRDCIAVDARIESITKKLGLTFASYASHEEFYLDVARQAGLNGWELDRLMYNFLNEVAGRIRYEHRKFDSA